MLLVALGKHDAESKRKITKGTSLSFTKMLIGSFGLAGFVCSTVYSLHQSTWGVSVLNRPLSSWCLRGHTPAKGHQECRRHPGKEGGRGGRRTHPDRDQKLKWFEMDGFLKIHCLEQPLARIIVVLSRRLQTSKTFQRLVRPQRPQHDG